MKSKKQVPAPAPQPARPAATDPRVRAAQARPAPQRPQAAPAVLQRKHAGVAPAPRPQVAQRPAPKAPPAYRPQPAPRCLQPKAATPAPKSPTPSAQSGRTPAAPPAYRPQPIQKCLQAKPAVPRPAPTAAPKPAPARGNSKPKPQAPQPPSRARNAVQAKFTLKGKELNLGDVNVWYSEHIQTMGESVPAKNRNMLQILLNSSSENYTIDEFDAEADPPGELVKFLDKREKEFRPGVTIYNDAGKGTWSTYGGALSVSKPGKLTNWDLGAHSTLSASALGQDYTELAHVAFKSSYFSDAEVNTAYGSNPGEFGTGFYLTTAHDTVAPSKISTVWKPEGKAAPDVVIKFRIANDTLSKLVGDDANLRDFLIYVLQHKDGYPMGMNEVAAVALMDRINAQGKVLIFPDNKDTKVVIKTGEAKKNWREYTESNAGGSSHYIVIGPQRPGALDGVRQIAFRGGGGQYIINSLKRSLQTISGADPTAT